MVTYRNETILFGYYSISSGVYCMNNIVKEYLNLSKHEQKEIPQAVRCVILGYDETCEELSLFLIDRAIINNEKNSLFLKNYWEKNRRRLEAFERLMKCKAISQSESSHFPLYQGLLHASKTDSLEQYTQCLQILLDYNVPTDSVFNEAKEMVRVFAFIRFLYEDCSDSLPYEQIKALILSRKDLSIWLEKDKKKLTILNMIKDYGVVLSHDLIKKTLCILDTKSLNTLLDALGTLTNQADRNKLIDNCINEFESRGAYRFNKVCENSYFKDIVKITNERRRQLCLEMIIESIAPLGTLNIIKFAKDNNWLGMDKDELIYMAGKTKSDDAVDLLQALLNTGLVDKDSLPKLLEYPFPSALSQCLRSTSSKSLLSGSSARDYLSFFLKLSPAICDEQGIKWENMRYSQNINNISRSLAVLINTKLLAPDSRAETIRLLEDVLLINMGFCIGHWDVLEFLYPHILEKRESYDLIKVIDLTKKILEFNEYFSLYSDKREKRLFREYCQVHRLSYEHMKTMLDNQKELMTILRYIYRDSFDLYEAFDDKDMPLLLNCSGETIQALSLILKHDEAFPNLEEVKKGKNGMTTRPYAVGFYTFYEPCEIPEIHRHKVNQIREWLKTKDFNLAQYLEQYLKNHEVTPLKTYSL